MPIFFQQDIDENTRLAVWEINEPEAFFLKEVPLKKEITHPHKRLQHLAGRYLLKYLFPGFPLELILIADTRKPFLADEAYHFSISHCGNFAAVLVSRTNRVGVDIELLSEKAERLRNKFVSTEEQFFFEKDAIVYKRLHQQLLSQTEVQLSTLIWSCKEAGFKWYGSGGVDFREHMRIQRIEAGDDRCFHINMQFMKNESVFLSLHSRNLNGLWLSYVVTGR